MVYWVDNKTAPKVKQRKEPVFSDAVLWFADEIGKTPTIPQAAWFNMIQAELLGLAEYLGVTPDKLDDNQLAVGLKAAFDKVGVDIQGLPKVLDALGESRKDAASQRIVNVVNQLAKDAQTAANLANDKANQAKQEAYEAGQSAALAHNKIAHLTHNSLLVSEALNKLMQDKQINVVCIGDSITYGYDETSDDKLPPAEGHVRYRAPIQYPLQLQKELRRIYATNSINAINYGYSGDTVKSSYERDAWKIDPKCNLAIIMFGINDEAKNLSITTFSEYLVKWIERLNNWETGVILMTPTVLNSGGTSKKLDGFRFAMKQVADLYGCKLFETNEFVDSYSKDAIYSDNTHFNKEGYKILGNSLAWYLASNCDYKRISSNIDISSTESNSITNGTRYYQPYSFNLNSLQLRLDEKSEQLVTFPFYLDCASAELYLNGFIGKGSNIIIDSDNLRASTFIKGGDATTENYKAKANIVAYPKRLDTLCGTVIGRGWHCLSITAPTGTLVGDYKGTYIGSIRVKPIEQLDIYNSGVDRVEKKCFVIFDPVQSDSSGVPEASVKSSFKIPSTIVSHFHTSENRWASSMPIGIKVIQGTSTESIQVSECLVHPYMVGNNRTFKVVEIFNSSNDVPKVIAINELSEREVEIVLNRTNAGWIKIIIDVYDYSLGQSLLTQ